MEVTVREEQDSTTSAMGNVKVIRAPRSPPGAPERAIALSVLFRYSSSEC